MPLAAPEVRREPWRSRGGLALTAECGSKGVLECFPPCPRGTVEPTAGQLAPRQVHRVAPLKRWSESLTGGWDVFWGASGFHTGPAS